MSGMLVVAEHRDGEIRPVTFELITCATDFAAASGGDTNVVIIGQNVDPLASAVSVEGVDRILTLEIEDAFNHDVYRQAIGQLAEALESDLVIAPHSINGMDYAPAVATDLGVPIVTDIIDAVPGSTPLEVTREMYGSKVETTVAVADDRAVLTVRGGEWEPTTSDADVPIEPANVSIDESAIGSTVRGFEEMAAGDVDISEADILVSVGRGIDEEENIELIETLAETLGATISASRPIVDSGWLPKNRQVGQSGKTVTPDVYIAIGISGAVQHVAGMKGAETIIAINNDPNAPIFDIADYGIVDDLFDVIPALTDALS